MAKCFGCGKEFDYEKYYGICPGCGVYNKEKLSEEMHEELHRQYDSDNPHEELHRRYDSNNPHAETHKSYAAENQRIYVAKPVTEKQKVKSSGASIALFICIIIGIVAGIIFPFAYLIGKSISVAGSAMESVLDEVSDYEDDGDIDFVEEDHKIPHMPEILSKGAGEAFQIGEEEPYTISVESAEVVAAAGTVSGFPESENLVAVKVNYERVSGSDGYNYYRYNMLDVPYVGYNGTFRECIEDYALTDYEDSLPKMNILDVWDISCDFNGTGVFLVFVPVGVTEFDFYMESRSEETNDVMEIYSIPLQISAGEEL